MKVIKALVEIQLPDEIEIDGVTLAGEELVQYVLKNIIDAGVSFEIEESEELKWSASGDRREMDIGWQTSLVGVEDDEVGGLTNNPDA